MLIKQRSMDSLAMCSLNTCYLTQFQIIYLETKEAHIQSGHDVLKIEPNYCKIVEFYLLVSF